MKRSRLLIVAVVASLYITMTLFSCSKSGDNTDTGGNGTATDSVLLNIGTNIIFPSYQKLATSTVALDAAAVAFTAAPASGTLTTLQNAFKDAYKAWSASSEFEFGPANDLSLTTHFTNAFPTDTVLIKGNIGGASYAIDGLVNYPAQGFPALDYLLFAYGNTTSLARFTTDSKAAGAKQYLTALTASLKAKAASVVTAWAPSGGNYLAKFIKGTGVDAGSSLSLLANSYVLDFDVHLQNFKIGIPIGLYGPNVLPKSPEKVEGYYSGLSVQLLVEQIKAYQNIYLGGTGFGLDDKVVASKAQSNGSPLNDVIKNQLTTLIAKLQALPDPLSAGVQNNDATINAAYTEVRKLTVLLKVDMSSALGIKISFQDDDGD